MKKIGIMLTFCLLSAAVIFGQSGRQEELGHFLFTPDASTTLANNAESLRLLDSMAADLLNMNLSAGQIHVSGYAAMASTENPSALSLNRALFIINELVRRGIPLEWFSHPIGYGSGVPPIR